MSTEKTKIPQKKNTFNIAVGKEIHRKVILIKLNLMVQKGITKMSLDETVKYLIENCKDEHIRNL